MEEGISRAPMVGVARPVMSMMLKAEAKRPEPSSVQVAVSMARQIEGGTPEVSLADVSTRQASVSTSPTPSAAGGAALDELPPQERSTPLEVGAGTS